MFLAENKLKHGLYEAIRREARHRCSHPAIHPQRHRTSGTLLLVMDCVEYFTQNTNLTGLGIRISIYAQTVILGKRRITRVLSRAHTALLRASTVTQVVLSPEKCTVALTVLGSTTLGLLVAGVVAVTQRQLSWYNAIAVENLIW